MAAHFARSVHDAAARPAWDRRAGMIARPASQTPICSVHQWGRCIATMRGSNLEPRFDSIETETALARVVVGSGLTLDDLIGELDQHPLGMVIP